MTKRYNIKDNFEDVYLRSNQVKMYLQNADPKLLKHPEFIKTINYISGHFFKKYAGVYKMSGFDFDDIHSTATMFGLMFAGYNKKYETPKDFYTIMMRFVSQRLLRMAGWMIKKFQLDELASGQLFNHDPLQSYDHLQPKNDQIHNYHTNIIIDGIYMHSKGPISDRESIRRLENAIDTLEEEYETVSGEFKKSESSERNFIKKERGRIKRQIKTAETTLNNKQKEGRDVRKKQKQQYQTLKQKLHENWQDHIDDLAYYSVSKFVSFGVRKSARNFCKKYGINYNDWAKQQVKERKLNSCDIITY